MASSKFSKIHIQLLIATENISTYKFTTSFKLTKLFKMTANLRYVWRSRSINHERIIIDQEMKPKYIKDTSVFRHNKFLT
jgi:hypothetical protein